MSKTQRSDTTWLQQMLGDWTYETRTLPDPGSAGVLATGTERVWAIGETWVVAENKGLGSDGSASHSLVTLGYDAAKGRFAGVHAGTMAPVLFHFDGVLGEGGQALLLDSEGPALSDDKALDKYRDVLRIIDTNRREQIALVLDEAGEWREFMRTRYQRSV
jgi:Protein of unknown function (DUF1579)